MSTVGMVRGKNAHKRTEQGNGGHGVANVFTPKQIKEWDMYVMEKDHTWIPLRPQGFAGICLLRRLKLAWGVFTGRYDVLTWPTE